MSSRDPFKISVNNEGLLSTRSELAWEESVLDTRTSVEGFSDNTVDTARPSYRWLLIIMLSCLVILGVRLVYLQLFKGGEYRVLAEGNRLRERILLAPRGYIKDTYGNIIAQNTVSFRLVAIPVDLPKEGLSGEIAALATMLHLDSNKIYDALKGVNPVSFEPVVIAEDLPKEQSILFETRSAEFVGFTIQATPIRDYPQPEVFSHVLGFTGIISEDEFSATAPGSAYTRQDYIGKTGIEKQYEQYLRGVNGQDQIEVDATGKVIKTLGSVAPKPGNILELNIDKELQNELYKNFSQKGGKGAAVALNPKTGQVLAFVSLPGFNNNLFAHGITTEAYQALLDDKNLPLFNRVIGGVYPPGSIVKPMVAAAALEEGIVNENTTIVDRGNLIIPNQFDPNISYNFYGWKRSGLGTMTVRSAIAESSDIYFYVVGGGHPSSPIKGLGADKLAEYYRKFKLGSPTGIDIKGEKPGTVADPEWKAQFFKKDPIMAKWYLGDTYHIAIGQGDMLVTPLQAAFWTATIANNGVGYKPTLLKKIVSQDGTVVVEPKPEIIAQPGISEKNIKIVQEGMRETVLNGSGRALTTLPISSAGKTGTSQFDGSDPSRTHAWFTSYAPYENPEIVVTVLVEAGGEGHAAAVPIARDTLKWWAENRYNK